MNLRPHIICKQLILFSCALALSLFLGSESKAEETTESLADKVSMFDLVLSSCGQNLVIDGVKSFQLESMWRLELLRGGFSANDIYSTAYPKNHKIVTELSFRAAEISGNRKDWFCQSLFEVATKKLGPDSPFLNLKFESGEMLVK